MHGRIHGSQGRIDKGQMFNDHIKAYMAFFSEEKG